MNTERELTIDELNAVSGGSLPLPAIVATILRGPTTNPSYSLKIAAWRELRQDFARGAWRIDRVGG
jgi:bacteriocin-like protein